MSRWFMPTMSREAANLLNDYIRQGYECQESDWQEKLEKQSDSAVEIQSRHTREVDRMVHRLDGRYYYDEMGYLRSTERDVRHLLSAQRGKRRTGAGGDGK